MQQSSQQIFSRDRSSFSSPSEAAAVPDPLTLDISLVVNGEIRMRGNTRQMVFSPFELISAASEVVTLSPGDVIATGTIAGVGPAKMAM